MDEVEYATRFAIEHAHYTRDLPFWQAAARRQGDPVLDVGCASGRVSVALASAGFRVWSVDTSRAMLDELLDAAESADCEQRVVPHCQDMRELDLGRTFPLIIVPMNTFQLMHTSVDQDAALQSLARHLEPKGELIIEVANPDFGFIQGSLGELHPAGMFFDRSRGVTLVHSSRYDTFDESAKRATFTWRIDEQASSGETTTFYREFDVRLFPPSELLALLSANGLQVRESLGDFDGSPLTDESDLQLHRCVPAA